MSLSLDKIFFGSAKLRMNKISLVDDLIIPFGLNTTDAGTFWDISSLVPHSFGRAEALKPGQDDAIIGYFEMLLDPLKRDHSRTVYNYWDLLSDYGGFKEGLFILFAPFIGSLPEHLFLLKAIQKLFFAHTSEKHMFDDTSP